MVQVDDKFEWTVAGEYAWLTGRRAALVSSSPVADERFLIALFDENKRRVSRPLAEHDALFQTFAEVELTESGIQSFAQKYGALGGKVGAKFSYTQPSGEEVTLPGESMTFWKNEIQRMRNLVEGYSGARANDAGEPADWVQALPAPQESDTLENILVRHHVRGAVFSTAKAQREALAHQVNIELAVGALGFGLLPVIALNEKAEAGQLLFRPTSLIEALWLQFAEAICSNASFRACKNCQQWSRVRRLRDGRPARLYCSHRCQMQASRALAADARKLHQQGKSIADISAQLQMPVGAVEKACAKATRGRRTRQKDTA